MNKVYAVGVLQIDESPNTRNIIQDDRLWHLFANFEDAERCILENRGDIFEYSYNYALIEESLVIDPNDPHSKNDHLSLPREWWYRADYSKASEENDFSPEIKACEKPKSLERMCFFWIG